MTAATRALLWRSQKQSMARGKFCWLVHAPWLSFRLVNALLDLPPVAPASNGDLASPDGMLPGRST
eukprot:7278015-Pyramimonas_sp.AAC.1